MTAKSCEEQLIRLFHSLQLSPAFVTGYSIKSGDYLACKIKFNPIVPEEGFWGRWNSCVCHTILCCSPSSSANRRPEYVCVLGFCTIKLIFGRIQKQWKNMDRSLMATALKPSVTQNYFMWIWQTKIECIIKLSSKNDAPVKIFWPKELKYSKYLKLSKKLFVSHFLLSSYIMGELEKTGNFICWMKINTFFLSRPKK